MVIFPDQVPRPVRIRVVLAWLGLLALLGFYWLQLYHSHQTALREAEQQAQLRAGQTAHALAYQVESQFRKLNFMVLHLGEHWKGHDDPELRQVIAMAQRGLPEGALSQVAIADPQGRIVFSSLNPPGKPLVPVSIADRAHFREHLDASEPRLYFSEPLLGRISGQWSVQFTRPLFQQGRFVGVIVLSISVEHLSEAFRNVFPDPSDVVVLLRSDGTYLTRSHGLDGALGRKVPADREFLRDAKQTQGVYEAVAPVDGVQRYYAWHRIPGFPVVLSLGLSKEKVLAPVHNALRHSHIQNAVGTLLLLLSSLWITGLVLFKAAQNQNLLETREHLRQAVEAVRDGLWSWELRSGHMHWDKRCHEMLGYLHSRLPERYADWCALLHPNDRELVETRLQQHVQAGLDQVIALECRLQGPGDSYHWVELRGRVIGCQREGGEPRFIGTCTDIGARVAESQLRRALLDRSTAAILLITPQRRIIQASSRAHQLFASPGQTLIGADASVLHLDAAHYEGLNAAYASLHQRGEARQEYPLKDASGATRWFDMHAILCDPDDPRSDIVWTLTDITARHLAERALETQSLRLTTLLERFPAGVLLEDAASHIVMANRSSCRLLGLDPEPHALEGLSHADLLQRLAPCRAAWLQLPDSRGEKRHMMEVMDDAGHTLEVDWVPIARGAEMLGHVWLLRDISERKQKEQELATLASTDALTSLPNRRSFMAELQAHLAQPDQLPPRGVLLMLDIDHFKRVNDSYGHPVGDVVLQHVAQIIRHSLRKEDTAGRLGGEEFAVLLLHVDAAAALLLAERLRENVARNPAVTEAGRIAITISIGLVELLDQGSQKALVQADQALYEAKAGGRNRVCVAECGMGEA